MPDTLSAPQTSSLAPPGFGTLETVFAALGRVLVVLDREFRVIRASRSLDDLARPGAVEAALGRPIEELVGARLFGPSESLREALEQGHREEGRRAILRCGEESARLVSLTAAVLPSDVTSHCDPRARYIVVLRPAETDNGLVQSMLSSHGLVARSPAMRGIVHLVESLHRSEATVLVTGESGTGKELIARALHANSPRCTGPFVAVNCGALPGDLLESELFGHVRGAFTGAVRDRVGRIDLARGGTLFLDEVGDIPPHLQVKLLRVLQERRFERVGESTPRPMDARVIAATNVDLAEAIRVGRFRDDLYYRLRVVPIHVPPLRERVEDIPLIAHHLLAHIGGREGRALLLSPDTLAAMARYPWPGNVRELGNALEYAVATCTGQTIQIENLPPELRQGAERSVLEPASAQDAAPLGDALPEDPAERLRILQTLESARWNRGRAAELLGMSRSTLWRRMKELGIE
ncbi:MAG TPA: sigma-54 dependent transcriptional regulator [Thermoanaerobaculia bacterium]|nr:sigma-54 dependent transcriptional regulator [Thermoanaerobaculia bacterium]